MGGDGVRRGTKIVIVLLFVVLNATMAGKAGAQWGLHYSVVLSDSGPEFYDTAAVGEWPFYYYFKLWGEVDSYSTSWYEGDGTSTIVVLVVGVYYLDEASVTVTNTEGYRLHRTYTQDHFTGTFFYPFLDDLDGGPRSTMRMEWDYTRGTGGTY